MSRVFRNITCTGLTSSGSIDVTGNITVSGTVDGVDIAGNINQDVRTTASPSFVDVSASGEFLGGNGTAGAPSFTFTSDTDTGMYRVGADSLGLTTGGTVRLTIADATSTFANNLVVSGDLTVNGTTTTVNSETTQVADPLFKYALGNTTDTVDIGFYGEYDTGTTAKFAGIFRDASAAGTPFTFFQTTETEPTTTVNPAGTNYAQAPIAALSATFQEIAVDATSGQINSLTGALTLATSSNDNIILDPNGTGLIQFGSGGTEYTIPKARGTDGQILQINGSGVMSFQDIPASSTGVTATSAFGTDNVMLKSDGVDRGSQATGIAVDDSNNMSGIGTISSGAITSTAGLTMVGSITTTSGALTLTTATNQGIVINPNGTGTLTIGSGTDLYTLPTADGTANQILQTDGSGAVTFVDVPASATSVTAASTFGTDNILLKSDGTSRGSQATGITVADTTNNMSGVGTLGCGAITSTAGLTMVGSITTTSGDLTLTAATNSDVILAPAGTGTLSVNSAYTLPLADGSADQILQTDGSGALTFIDIPNSTTAVTATSTFGTDNVLLKSDGTGRITQATGITIADTTNNMSGVGTLGCGAITSTAGLTMVGSITTTSGDLTLTAATNSDVILAPAGTGTLSVNSAYTLPLADGSSDQVLVTNGSGIVSFAAVPGATENVTAASTFGTDNVILKSDGTSRGSQASGITIADTTNDISGAGTISCDGIRHDQAAVSTTSTIVTTASIIRATGGAGGIILTLPDNATQAGREYMVIKVDAAAGSVTIQRGTTDTIDDGSTTSIVLENQYDHIRLVSDGTGIWYIM